MSYQLNFYDLKMGDLFLLNDNETIVQVTQINKTSSIFLVNCLVGNITFNGIQGINGWTYNGHFTFNRVPHLYAEYKHLDIKCRYLSLTDKLGVL